jgi:hypothetical protein
MALYSAMVETHRAAQRAEFLSCGLMQAKDGTTNAKCITNYSIFQFVSLQYKTLQGIKYRRGIRLVLDQPRRWFVVDEQHEQLIFFNEEGICVERTFRKLPDGSPKLLR